MKKTAMVVGGMLALGLVTNGFGDTPTNVYSQNAVGYINIPLTNSFTLMSVQLGSGPASTLTIGNIFPTAHEGTTMYVFDTNTGTYFSFLYSGGQWYDMQTWLDGSTQKVERGVAFWVAWTGSSTNLNITGEVPGSLVATTPVNIANGYALLSYPYPTATLLSATQIGANAQDGDEIFVWTGTQYKIYGRFGGSWSDYDTWLIVDPMLNPGQGFWYKSGTQRTINETKPYNWP
jgi:hypothetical protein